MATVLVHARNTSSAAIGFTTVTLLSAGGGVAAQGEANIFGDVNLTVPAGSYSVLCSKPGVIFSETPFAVSEPVSEITVTGVQTNTYQVPTINKCKIYGFIDTSASDEHSIFIDCVSVGRGSFSQNQNFSGGYDSANVGIAQTKILKRTPRNDGYWEVDLPIGTLVRVWIPDQNYSKHFKVPDLDCANIVDIRPLLGHANYVWT